MFSREEYYRLAEMDILEPEERTELIYGRIIARMSPMGRPHSVAVSKTATALAAAFGNGYAVEQQMSLQLGNGLEPQPDVMVLPGTFRTITRTRLVPLMSCCWWKSPIPLCAMTEAQKPALYAADNIPDYWLVNLRARTLEVRRQPENGEYLSLDVYREGESVAPLAAPNAPVRVADSAASGAARRENR